MMNELIPSLPFSPAPNLLATPTLFLVLLTVLLPLLAGPALGKAESGDELQSLSDKSLRGITGHQGLSFDTITLDGKLDQIIPAVTDNNYGMFLGPFRFGGLSLGQTTTQTKSQATVGGVLRNDVMGINFGMIRGALMTDVQFGSFSGVSGGSGMSMGSGGGGGLSSSGSVAVGGVVPPNASVEIANE
jgi:hypothetical protein